MNGLGNDKQQRKQTLVLGGTGKTGRRVAHRLAARGVPVRLALRRTAVRLARSDRLESGAARRGSGLYRLLPGRGGPGASDAIGTLADLALQSGVRRLVLLSGRGEEEAQLGEKALRDSGAEWTILRSSWFSQNFSENFLADGVLSGEVALPVGAVEEPFVDAEDIADVAVAALTEDGHGGQVYELTGPRLLTFADAVEEIAKATGRKIRYLRVPAEQYASMLVQQNVPDEFVTLLTYLFTTVLDGRNAFLTDGVQRALGRAPRDFADYAREAAATGMWGA